MSPQHSLSPSESEGTRRRIAVVRRREEVPDQITSDCMRDRRRGASICRERSKERST